MSIPLHDTHFHLDLFENPRKILEQIEHEKIYTVAVTNIPAVFDRLQELVKESKYVRAALGLHPELAFREKQQMPLFLDLLKQTRYVGEIGLDNYKKTHEDYIVQKDIFEQIIRACNSAGKKILTVHSRRAEKDVISTIGPDFSGKVILHWYSGSVTEINRALSYGFYFSVNYAMTQSENGRKIVDLIPIERILLETDGPFIKVHNEPSTPVMIGIVVAEIAKLKNKHNAIDIMHNNLRTILS